MTARTVGRTIGWTIGRTIGRAIGRTIGRTIGRYGLIGQSLDASLNSFTLGKTKKNIVIATDVGTVRTALLV